MNAKTLFKRVVKKQKVGYLIIKGMAKNDAIQIDFLDHVAILVKDMAVSAYL